MKDEFLPAGLVTKQDSASDGTNGLFSIGKMFWKQLNKNNVPFYNSCCSTASTTGVLPVSYNSTIPQLQYFNGTTLVAIPIAAPTTTPTFTTVTTTNIQGPSGAPISVNTALIEKHSATAFNTTGTLTAAQLSTGYITSTSVAAVTATLPTATLLATQLGAAAGTTFDFIVDNHSGANTVTVAVGAGDTSITPVVTGEGTLTVASGTIGQFRLVFTSATTAFLARTI